MAECWKKDASVRRPRFGTVLDRLLGGRRRDPDSSPAGGSSDGTGVAVLASAAAAASDSPRLGGTSSFPEPPGGGRLGRGGGRGARSRRLAVAGGSTLKLGRRRSYVTERRVATERKKRNVLRKLHGLISRLCSRQPVTSFRCETMDTALVHRLMCLLCREQFITLVASVYSGSICDS